jgi:hypothetical protein
MQCTWRVLFWAQKYQRFVFSGEQIKAKSVVHTLAVLRKKGVLTDLPGTVYHEQPFYASRKVLLWEKLNRSPK